MISLYPEFKMSFNNMEHRFRGECLIVHEYHAVIPFDGGKPLWFERIGCGTDKIHFDRREVPTVWDGNVSIHTMDPISAVLQGIVTPEEVKMPAGVAGLLALMKA
jgi:hypothetical protein